MSNATESWAHDSNRRVSTTVAANTSWLSLTRLAADLLNLVLFVVLSRQFGPSGIGQYAYGFAIATLANAAVTLGSDDYAIRECARLPRSGQRAFLGKLLGAQLLCTPVVMAGIGAVAIITQPGSTTLMVILLLCAYQLAAAYSRTLFVPAFAQESMTWPAVAELIFRGAIILSSLALVVVFRASLAASLIPFGLGGGGLIVVAAISARRHVGVPRVTLRPALLVPLVKAIWPFAASMILFYLYARADLILVSWILGDASAGIYASGLKFLEFGIMPLVFLAFAAYPTLSQLYPSRDIQFADTTEALLRTAMAMGGVLVWAMFYLVPLVVVPVLGVDFGGAEPVIKGMAILGLILGIQLIASRVLLAANLQVLRVRLQVRALLLNILLNLVLIPLLGVMGAVAALVSSQVFLATLYFRAIWNELRPSRLFRTGVHFLLPALFAVVIAVSADWLKLADWLQAGLVLVAFCLTALGSRFVKVPELQGQRGVSSLVQSILGAGPRTDAD